MATFVMRRRANNEPRTETRWRPIMDRGRKDVSLVRKVCVRDLCTWIAGPLSQIWRRYELLGANSHQVVLELQLFLCHDEMQCAHEREDLLGQLQQGTLALRHAKPELKA